MKAPCSLDGHAHQNPPCRHLVPDAPPPELQKSASAVRSVQPAVTCPEGPSPPPPCPRGGVYPRSQG